MGRNPFEQVPASRNPGTRQTQTQGECGSARVAASIAFAANAKLLTALFLVVRQAVAYKPADRRNETFGAEGRCGALPPLPRCPPTTALRPIFPSAGFCKNNHQALCG